MNHKLKLLGLGVVAALAMGAVAVISASASAVDDANPGHFTTGAGTVRITGAQTLAPDDIAIHAAGQSITCTEVFFHSVGAPSATQPSLTTLPTFGGHCTMAGNTAAVHVNGCHFLVTIGTRRSAHNTLHLQCPPNQVIDITSTIGGSPCTLTIKSQTLTGVSYAQQGLSGTTTHDIETNFTVKNIHYERHGSVCGILGTTAANAELTGKATFQGFDGPGNQTAITATGSLD